MARFRNVSSDTRLVGYGVARRWVDPGAIFEVPDELVDSYDQPGIWELVEGGSASSAATRKPLFVGCCKGSCDQTVLKGEIEQTHAEVRVRVCEMVVGGHFSDVLRGAWVSTPDWPWENLNRFASSVNSDRLIGHCTRRHHRWELSRARLIQEFLRQQREPGFNIKASTGPALASTDALHLEDKVPGRY